MRRLALTLGIVSLGCGGAGPPKGPAYTPSGTQEAKTACPKERELAHHAREELLGSAHAKLRLSAAKAVMAHGECEQRALEAEPLRQGSQEEWIATLRDLRERMQDVARLFQETRNYKQPEWTVKAFAAEASVVLYFRDQVPKIIEPHGLDAQERVVFAAEMKEILSTLDAQAAELLRRGVAVSLESGEASKVRALACTTLRSLGRSPPVCSVH